MPGHGAVVGIAGSYDPTRTTYAAHLAEGGYWIIDVLEHLVGMHDVERTVAEGEVVHIARTESDVCDVIRGIVCCPLDDRFGTIDSDHTARFDAAGKVHRECAGTTSDIEKRATGGKVSGEVAGRVVDGSPSM
jgi:hypothetical protein